MEVQHFLQSQAQETKKESDSTIPIKKPSEPYMKTKPLNGSPMKQKHDDGGDFNPLSRDSKKEAFHKRNKLLEQNKEIVA